MRNGARVREEGRVAKCVRSGGGWECGMGSDDADGVRMRKKILVAASREGWRVESSQ